MIRYVSGDATEPVGDGCKIVAHVCNDLGAWGAGFSGAVTARWPVAEAVYRSYFDHLRLYRRDAKLGTNLCVQVERELWVANMLAQRGLRGPANPIPLDYEALRACLTDLAGVAGRLKASVHMPKIGAGLAGGSWVRIEKMVAMAFPRVEVTIYVLEKGAK